MSGFKEPNFADRQKAAQQAKQNILNKFKAQPGPDDPAVKQRQDFNKLVAAFFLSVAIVLLVARIFGIAATKIGQPRVMGEVIAGICLGPSVLGAISPNLQAGEQRDFVFKPTQSRRYTIATHGGSDTLLALFEQVDGEPRFITGDDDSGEDRNASIRQKLWIKARNGVSTTATL